MAETTINNTQEVVGIFSASRDDGSALTITGLVGSVISGQGTFDASTDSTGNPLPANQMAFISAAGTTGDTEYAVVVNFAETSSMTAQVIVTVIEGVINLSITFLDPVPRRTPPTP